MKHLMPKLDPRIGWTLAAALFGTILAAGFQDATEKVGSVDLDHLMTQSNLGQASQARLTKMQNDRIAVLKFMKDNRVLSADQATRFRELSLKDPLTTQESAELDRIKADIVADAKRDLELESKTSGLTPEEHALLNDFAKRSQTTDTLGKQWQSDFVKEMDDAAADARKQLLDNARTSIQTIAKAQGYSVVFEAQVAPYAANDLTDAALQTMNAKK
jgi:Skp family chaperone for outer membrane proteins